MSIKLRWLGLACFEIVLPSGKVLITDPAIDIGLNAPIKCKEVTGADYITVTRDSPIALSDVGSLVHKFDSKVMCNHQMASPLSKFFDIDEGNIIEVNIGDNVVFDDLQVEIKKAKNASPLRKARIDYEMAMGKKPDANMSVEEMRRVATMNWITPGGKELAKKMMAAGITHTSQHLNFLFHMGDNLRIYYYDSGDYDFLKSELIKAHPNVLIIQLGGNDPKKIAEFAALSGAEVVIPSHHDIHPFGGHGQLVRVMGKYLSEMSKACLLDVIPGKWYEIGVKVASN